MGRKIKKKLSYAAGGTSTVLQKTMCHEYKPEDLIEKVHLKDLVNVMRNEFEVTVGREGLSN